MPSEPIDPALVTFAAGMMMLSIFACMNVLHMRRSGPVLSYEPRQPVPWGAVGGVLAGTYLLLTILSALNGSEPDDPTAWESISPWTLLTAMVEQTFIVVGVLFVIAMFSKATWRDLGIPASARELLRDICIGGAACLAALAPVHLIQQLFMRSSDEVESGHPLIRMVLESPPSPWVLVLAGVAAVVVAPICEEITFRLLLQGWLERWEDARLGWRKQAVDTSTTETPAVSETDATVATIEAPVLPIAPLDTAEPLLEDDPPVRGVAGLPYGWLPIIVSAAAFGLAHFGYGPEPIPLFFLALVLGYLYQRTHRIVPSIVAHALFNLFTMIVLWRIVYHRG